MGKQVPRSSRKNKEEEMDDNCDNQSDDELYRPYLIHANEYVVLTEQILTLMPSERNVLLTMNEYDLNEINPTHPNTEDSPTHVIIFCIRFVAAATFQPIGALLVYKHKDQSRVLAECLKAYINDLWKLGLYVVGTVSPPFESFKGMISHLVDVKDFDTYSGNLVYSVAPIKEIVHIYDIQFLFVKLQNLFKEGDIKFVEGTREHRATWNDIQLVLNVTKLPEKTTTKKNKNIPRIGQIFTKPLFEQFLESEALGVLSKNAGGSAVLLSCIRSFLQFTEIDLVDLNRMCRIEGWNNFTNILHTMVFQKSKKTTCTKEKPTMVRIINNTTAKRQINFNGEEDVDCNDEVVEKVSDTALSNEQEENSQSGCEVVEDSKNKKESKKTQGKTSKQKKGKVKESPEKKLHSKKPYEKQKSRKNTLKNTNTSQNQKTDFGNNENNNTIKEISNTLTDNLADKLSGKTEDSHHIKIQKTNQEELDNKINFGCDRDKNNNSDESLQISDTFKLKNPSLDVKPNNKTKLNNKKNRPKFRDDDFDFVVNNEKFLESFFTGYKNSWNSFKSETKSNKRHTTKATSSHSKDIETGPTNPTSTEAKLINPQITKANSIDIQTIEAVSNNIQTVEIISIKPLTIEDKSNNPQSTEAKSKSFQTSEKVLTNPQTSKERSHNLQTAEEMFSNLQITEATSPNSQVAKPESNNVQSGVAKLNSSQTAEAVLSNPQTTEAKINNPHVTEAGQNNPQTIQPVLVNPQITGERSYNPQVTEARPNNSQPTETKSNNSQVIEANLNISQMTKTQSSNPQTTEGKPIDLQSVESTSNSFLTAEGNLSNPQRNNEYAITDNLRQGGPHKKTGLNKDNSVESYDDFCSQSDEETESCVTKICDKVPTLVESLDTEEIPPDNFENNNVTREFLSTVSGMKKLMENLMRRRVRVAKPDAFIVEHIDFFVDIIKRDFNKISPVPYSGPSYDFFNAAVAFAAVENDKGLYIVKT